MSTYKKFSQFRQERKDIEFNNKIDEICHGIATSGVSFNEFWQYQGLPTFVRSSTEEELMEGWNPASWDWQGLGNNLRNSPMALGLGAAGRTLGGAAYGAIKGGLQGEMAGATGSQLGKNTASFFNPQGQQQQAQPQKPAQQPQEQQAPKSNKMPLTPDMQRRVEKIKGDIKTQFTKALQGVTQQYAQSKDSVGYQLANQILSKMTDSLDKMTFNRTGQKFDPSQIGGDKQEPKNTVGSPTFKDMWKNRQANQNPLNTGRKQDGYGNQLDGNGQIVGSNSTKVRYGNHFPKSDLDDHLDDYTT